MKEYDFTLKYRLGYPTENAEQHIEALAESSSQDAVVGIGRNGRISLNFIRKAENALDAISSAIADVHKAIPDAKLVETSPDYVGVTDIADLMGFSRQYMRKLIQANGARVSSGSRVSSQGQFGVRSCDLPGKWPPPRGQGKRQDLTSDRTHRSEPAPPGPRLGSGGGSGPLDGTGGDTLTIIALGPIANSGRRIVKYSR